MLEINNTCCGDPGIIQLTNLVKDSKIKYIDCDNSMATSESAYTELWQTISEIRQKRQVFFSFPEKDLQRLLDYRKLRTEKYESIKNNLEGK